MKQEEQRDATDHEKKLNRMKFQSFYGEFDDNIANKPQNNDFDFN